MGMPLKTVVSTVCVCAHVRVHMRMCVHTCVHVCACVQHSHGGSQPPVALAPGKLVPPSDLLRHTHDVQTYIWAKHSHMLRKKKKRKRKRRKRKRRKGGVENEEEEEEEDNILVISPRLSN